MRLNRTIRPTSVLLMSLLVGGAGCMPYSMAGGIEPRPILPSVDHLATVSQPVRVALADGSTILFPNGVLVGRDTVWGAGHHFDVTLTTSEAVALVPVRDVVSIQTFVATTGDRNRRLVVLAGVAAMVAMWVHMASSYRFTG